MFVKWLKLQSLTHTYKGHVTLASGIPIDRTLTPHPEDAHAAPIDLDHQKHNLPEPADSDSEPPQTYVT